MDGEQIAHPTELLAGYALGILEAAETAAVESHLQGCPECRAEVAALRDVSAFLALAVPQLPAPKKLRQRLLEEAGQKSGAADSADERRGLRRFLARPILRPAVAALILLLVISNIYFLVRLQQTLPEQALQEQRAINLWATDAAPEADGVLLIRAGEPTGTLVVNGLPDLGAEQQYQLWLVKDEERVSGAIFSVADEGITSITVSAPEELSLYTRCGITIEPAGGSPEPTGDGVLRWAAPE